MPTLSLHCLSKTYPGGVAAVRNLSLEIPDGRLAVLVGPSGSGKSTLLRLIAGLERPTDGDVRVDGESIIRLPPHRRDLAMVFQEPTLYPYLSVRRNLAHGLKRLGVSRAEIDDRVARAAALLAITPLLDRRPQQLSGGEAQRVALGRALTRRPGLLLLDEPLSSLDAMLRTQLRGELRRLHAELGGTTLHVTHDQTEALSLAELLVVIHEGRVQQIGPPLDVYDRPANRFVAGFLGQPGMNLWAGRVEDGAFRAADGALLGPKRFETDGEFILGVRPEQLRVNEPVGEPFGPATVTAVEPQGHDALLRLDVGGQTAIALTPPPCRLTAGEQVDLWAIPDHLHLFSANGEGSRVG